MGLLIHLEAGLPGGMSAFNKGIMKSDQSPLGVDFYIFQASYHRINIVHSHMWAPIYTSQRRSRSHPGLESSSLPFLPEHLPEVLVRREQCIPHPRIPQLWGERRLLSREYLLRLTARGGWDR
jgi:hypothetical protein